MDAMRIVKCVGVFKVHRVRDGVPVIREIDAPEGVFEVHESYGEYTQLKCVVTGRVTAWPTELLIDA